MIYVHRFADKVLVPNKPDISHAKTRQNHRRPVLSILQLSRWNCNSTCIQCLASYYILTQIISKLQPVEHITLYYKARRLYKENMQLEIDNLRHRNQELQRRLKQETVQRERKSELLITPEQIVSTVQKESQAAIFNDTISRPSTRHFFQQQRVQIIAFISAVIVFVLWCLSKRATI